MILKVKHVKRNFTIVLNEAIHDPDLSWKAKGIWLYCMSLPDDWSIRICEITQHATDGEASTSAGLKELQEAGYVYRQRVQGGWDTVVSETKQKKKQTLVKDEPIEITKNSIPSALSKLPSRRAMGLVSLSHEFLQAQKRNYPSRVNINVKAVHTGAIELEKAIRLDGFKLRDLRSCLLWVANDKTLFWNKNLYALSTLRKRCRNDKTKLENIWYAYEDTQEDKSDEDEIELPKRVEEFVRTCTLHGTPAEIRTMLSSLVNGFENFPSSVRDLFKYNGGVHRFIDRYLAWLQSMPKYPHARTVTGTSNKFWRQYVQKLEKENGINFTTGRRK